jgi:hypothetical protein
MRASWGITFPKRMLFHAGTPTSSARAALAFMTSSS